MAGYKETPRQKMIAMMYLVLTALLALNVSKEILDAFLVVNKSMESTNESVAVKTREKYTQFENQYNLNTNKVSPFWERALNVQTEANQLIDYLDYLKYKVVQVSERKDSAMIMDLYYIDTVIYGHRKKVLDLALVPTKDKYDATTFYMIRENQNGEAWKLSERMQVYRDTILNVMGLPANSRKVGLITNMDGITYRDADGNKQSWEMHNFYHTILAADITIFNKIIAEVRTAEFNALNKLYASVSEKDFKFDNVAARVIPKSTYVFKGQNYEAEVLVAAYDSKTQLDSKYVTGTDKWKETDVNRAKTVDGEEGTIKLKFNTKTEGLQKYAGIIEMRDPATDEIVEYPYNSSYFVAPPSLTVAPLKMNVFYIGVDNPISISAAGLSKNQIKPVIDMGKLKKDGSNWIVRIDKKPKSGAMATVSASADIDGKRMSLGKSEFRVKRVPSPTAEIAGMTDGQLDKNVFLASAAIIPNMKDFEFDLYFVVTSYTFATVMNGDWLQKNVKGNVFSDEVKSIIRNGKRKQKYFFEKIQAKGPDGTIRSLNPISLELK
ncbi:MAG: gliding motility protein GldM [Lentimicrobiaceae bacterium]|nr:gliding motility protein GldM [Lentimicrobiaceae bacterium]